MLLCSVTAAQEKYPNVVLIFADDLGSDTAVFGKWHLGFKEGKNDWQEPLRPGPQDLGFDYYFGMPVVNSAPPCVYVENDKIVGADRDDPLMHVGRSGTNVTPITPIPPEAAQRSGNQFSGAVEAHKLFNDFEVGTKLTEKATKWVKSRGEKPFFAYFSTTNVHHPFTPAKRGSRTTRLYCSRATTGACLITEVAPGQPGSETQPLLGIAFDKSISRRGGILPPAKTPLRASRAAGRSPSLGLHAIRAYQGEVASCRLQRLRAGPAGQRDAAPPWRGTENELECVPLESSGRTAHLS